MVHRLDRSQWAGCDRGFGVGQVGNSAVAVARTISIGWPYRNVLFMDVPVAYIKPNSSAAVQMKIAQLLQMVKGCQAMLGIQFYLLQHRQCGSRRR